MHVFHIISMRHGVERLQRLEYFGRCKLTVPTPAPVWLARIQWRKHPTWETGFTNKCARATLCLSNHAPHAPNFFCKGQCASMIAAPFHNFYAMWIQVSPGRKQHPHNPLQCAVQKCGYENMLHGTHCQIKSSVGVSWAKRFNCSKCCCLRILPS